ncbi:tRNA lysidine(34) synthetase TilS [Shewanella avicenniae]|uniref:tRNA(Ile)-lysidine synthase n=1 Tax=Shewanella avicenniae TaxID=2814294 RepID=A0ABX7QNI2_9GAMM|nr:tRNA lysidine(34) synthetase TilS [Shewanella avicenniae]QSX32443.1 tRNA lysidine(34) synthetase TilS [Shewanella avicenniae]
MNRALTDSIINELTSLLLQLPATAPAEERHLWLGFSGGMDSALLAYALSLLVRQQPELRHRVHLVHVHHGLNPYAEQWAALCSNLAHEYQLDSKTCYVKVDTRAGVSIEAEARSQRYQALKALMNRGDVLLTAHHQDDQLETLLLALKRGQGPKGLAAMGAIQTLADDYWQLRPMLHISRADIEQAVDELALDFVTDDSNFDTRYDRNFLRQAIIPELKQRWPAIAETAARSAQLCAEQQALLEEVAAEKLKPLLGHCAITEQATLLVAPLAQMNAAWQRQLVRQFCQLRKLAPPSQVQLEQLLQQLLCAESDATVALNFANVVYRRFNGALYVEPVAFDREPTPLQLTSAQLHDLLQGQLVLPLAKPWQAMRSALTHSGARIALDSLQGDVEIRYAISGSTRCHPHWRQQGRELKKVWQEAKVPVWRRSQIPLLYVDGELITAVGVFIEKSYLAHPDEAGIQLTLCCAGC